MANEIKAGFYVEDVKRRHLRNGDRLQVVLEKTYDNGEHKDLIDLLGQAAEVDMKLVDPKQSEMEFEDEE